MGHYPFMVNDEEPVDHGKADGELGAQGQDLVLVIRLWKPKIVCSTIIGIYFVVAISV